MLMQKNTFLFISLYDKLMVNVEGFFLCDILLNASRSNLLGKKCYAFQQVA